MYSLKEHFEEIEDRKLQVTLTDGTVYTGDYWGTISRLESFSGEDELRLDTGSPTSYHSFAESEIADVKVIDEQDGQ